MAALQASGAISLQDIEEQYNPGTNLPSRGLSEFYLGGSLVRANAGNNSSTNMSAGVPTSGTISFNDFYGQKRAFRKTYSSTATAQSLKTVFGDDYLVDYPKETVIKSLQIDLKLAKENSNHWETAYNNKKTFSLFSSTNKH